MKKISLNPKALAAILLITILSLSWVFAQESETSFTKTYGGPEADIGYSIIQTSDGGYALVGDTTPDASSPVALCLIKVNATGDQEWNTTIEGSEDMHGRAVFQTEDGDYIIAGSKIYSGVGTDTKSDAILIKLDSEGDEIWSEAYGKTDYEYGLALANTTDGGYIIAGYSSPTADGYSDVYVAKTDGAGTLQWNYTYGGNESDVGCSVIQTVDEGYAVAGYTNSSGMGRFDAWLLKLNSSGAQEWNHTYGGGNNEYGYSLIQTNEGGFAITGWTNSFGVGGSKSAYLVKTAADGTMEWYQSYGGAGDEEGNCLIATLEGGYAIAGYTATSGAGDNDVYLIKTNAAGGLLWNTTSGGIDDDRGYSLVEAEEEGFAVVGYTVSFGEGDKDVYLVKTNATGESIPPTPKPTPEATPTPSPTASPTPTPTATPTNSPTPTPTQTVTPSTTPTMTATPTASATSTPTAAPTASPEPPTDEGFPIVYIIVVVVVLAVAILVFYIWRKRNP